MPLMHCPGWWVLRQANHLGAEPGTQVYSMGRYDECPPKAGGVIMHTTWYISACLWSRSVSWWLAEISVELWEAVARRRLFVTMRYTNPRFTVVHLQWHVPVTLSAGTPGQSVDLRTGSAPGGMVSTTSWSHMKSTTADCSPAETAITRVYCLLLMS